MDARTLAADAEAGTRITVAGWVHELRDLGGIAFLILRDRTGQLQVKLEKDTLNETVLATGLDVHRESAVVVTGPVEDEPRAPTGVELVPESIEVLAEADPGLPLDPSGKVDAELSTRLDNRTLDLRRPESKAVFEVRSEVLRSARAFLRSIDCTEITTPKIVATGTEGGTDLFPITYFGREAFMNQSPQLFKQLIAGSGLERVFEIGPIFRAEEHNTPRHLNEATSIDIEVAFTDHAGAMDIGEGLLRAVYSDVAENCQAQLDTLGTAGEFAVPEAGFPRLTYEEAIERVNAEGDLDGRLEWGDDLSAEAERVLGDSVGGPYFITGWPTAIKPFYIQAEEADPTVSKGFDLMHPRFELASGGQREHRHEPLVAGLEAQGLDPGSFGYYTEMFRYGIPPHAGWGLGADRLVMGLLGLENVREAVLFPRDRQRLSP